jgi:hypothetical protein
MQAVAGDPSTEARAAGKMTPYQPSNERASPRQSQYPRKPAAANVT